jgi:hypothetical protein
MMPLTAVPPDVRAAAADVSHPAPMRRGSLTERFVKCGKAACACHRDRGARHGPYYSVSRVVDGQTQSRWLTADQAAVVRTHVAAAHRFRDQVTAYWAACERWADAELEAAADEADAAKKGASPARLRRRSTRRSTGS